MQQNNSPKKKRAVRPKKKKNNALQSHEVSMTGLTNNQSKPTNKEVRSQIKIQQSSNIPLDDETAQETNDYNYMLKPYQFLKFNNPPLHTILVPHFTIRSFTFVLSIIMMLCFIALLIYNSTKPQNNLTWNCSLFQVQNKYFPKLKYNYEIWRVFLSALFHSNIAHWLLNMAALQIYGYFIEWYYGKLKMILTIMIAIILSHFLCCLTSPYSISTTSSSILFALLALKGYFLFEYRSYPPLIHRRIFIYLLLALVIAINLIPIFVVNNVDYGAHIGGFLTGILLGFFFYFNKKQQNSILERILKIITIIILACIMIACITVTFIIDNQHYLALNNRISTMCNQ